VSPRAGLDVCKNLAPSEIRSPDRPACSQSLYRLSYPAHTINVHLPIIKNTLHLRLFVSLISSFSSLTLSTSLLHH
jgi:hypothetical protein